MHCQTTVVIYNLHLLAKVSESDTKHYTVLDGKIVQKSVIVPDDEEQSHKCTNKQHKYTTRLRIVFTCSSSTLDTQHNTAYWVSSEQGNYGKCECECDCVSNAGSRRNEWWIALTYFQWSDYIPAKHRLSAFETGSLFNPLLSPIQCLNVRPKATKEHKSTKLKHFLFAKVFLNGLQRRGWRLLQLSVWNQFWMCFGRRQSSWEQFDLHSSFATLRKTHWPQMGLHLFFFRFFVWK